MIPIESVEVSAYRIPTDGPESDGTACWQQTTLVLVRIHAKKIEGLGYTYAHEAAAKVVADTLTPLLVGHDALATAGAFLRMDQAVRNMGRSGIARYALSAVDTALWDLKAKLAGMALVDLIGSARDAIPVYGSGGFTNYDHSRLVQQMSDWVKAGIGMVKMKVGTRPEDDLARVAEVRAGIGQAGLFVDANGAYSVKQASRLGSRFAQLGVTWFEEPVSSDDLEGLAYLRGHLPMDVAAGEYGHDASYFRTMLGAEAIDVLQADATRCGGPTGFLQAAALAQAFHRPLSAHTAPSLHLHLCCAATPAVHLEWFHDHVRIESMLFEGAIQPVNGRLTPDRSRPGLGIAFNHREAARFAV